MIPLVRTASLGIERKKKAYRFFKVIIVTLMNKTEKESSLAQRRKK